MAPMPEKTNAVRLRYVDHVQLAMPAGGEERARAFYRDLLGLPEVPKPPPLAARGGAWFEDGQLKIHLGVDPEFRAARKAHPAIVVEGLAALTERVRAAGFEVAPDAPQQGFVRAYIFDPFGNRIEVMERTPDQPPADA